MSNSTQIVIFYTLEINILLSFSRYLEGEVPDKISSTSDIHRRRLFDLKTGNDLSFSKFLGFLVFWFSNLFNNSDRTLIRLQLHTTPEEKEPEMSKENTKVRPLSFGATGQKVAPVVMSDL